MTNQTQVSAELSEADVEDTARALRMLVTLEADKSDGDSTMIAVRHVRRAAAMAAFVSEMSGKTVMSEEAFRELHGKAERLSALEEGLEGLLRDAFLAGFEDGRTRTTTTGLPARARMYAARSLLTKEQTRG